MKNLDKRDYPSTMLDLGRLTYIFKAVRTALQRDSSMCCDRCHLFIQTDYVAEWRIVDRSKTFLKRTSTVFQEA
jgi:hypothetical protein